MNDLTTALAGQHVRALRARACLDRLQQLADCCRPSVLRRTASAVVQWLRKGQLGPGYVCC
ncbi:MAG: hypothetical protein Q8R60_12625 [Mycobacteriales bacterium]|nr:hypothetical protein [Mycobacteriales bacterium]